MEDVDSDEEFWENMQESEEVIMRETKCRPCQEEVDRHMATHIPYRSWCEFCVSGKSKNIAHKLKKSEEETVPKVSIDYAFMGKSKIKSDDEDKEEDNTPGFLGVTMILATLGAVLYARSNRDQEM